MQVNEEENIIPNKHYINYKEITINNPSNEIQFLILST